MTSSTNGEISKTQQFKRILQSKRLEFLMEAHNGLSARIVEEAGFKGIWASGLSISASMGVRDNNEASWTQVLDNLEFMSDATSIPSSSTGTPATATSTTCSAWCASWSS